MREMAAIAYYRMKGGSTKAVRRPRRAARESQP